MYTFAAWRGRARWPPSTQPETGDDSARGEQAQGLRNDGRVVPAAHETLRNDGTPPISCFLNARNRLYGAWRFEKHLELQFRTAGVGPSWPSPRNDQAGAI